MVAKVRFFILSFIALAIFFPFVSASGVEHENYIGVSVVGFNFVGGFVTASIIVMLILGIISLNKRSTK